VLLVVSFALVVLLLNHRKKRRELSHTERMKALEVGLPLPDAEVARARAVAMIGTLVPLFTLVAAIGATALSLARLGDAMFGMPAPQLGPILATVWTVSGIVIVTTVVLCIRTLRRLPKEPPPSLEPPSKPVVAEVAAGSEAFRERI
jgi:hypothetical protein